MSKAKVAPTPVVGLAFKHATRGVTYRVTTVAQGKLYHREVLKVNAEGHVSSGKQEIVELEKWPAIYGGPAKLKQG